MIVRVLGALAIGALASYYFDPVSGRRRRALLRDKLVHTRHELGDYAEGTAKDLRNRAQGLVAEARGMVERRTSQRRQAGSQVHVDPPEPQV
jgi:gas vesicle protein